MKIVVILNIIVWSAVTVFGLIDMFTNEQTENSEVQNIIIIYSK